MRSSKTVFRKRVYFVFCPPLLLPRNSCRAGSVFPPFRIFPALDALPAPDVLEETVALGEAVEGVVALTHGADEAAEGVDVVLAGDGAAVLVNLCHGNLNGAVVLGLDDAVGGAALAGDVAV